MLSMKEEKRSLVEVVSDIMGEPMIYEANHNINENIRERDMVVSEYYGFGVVRECLDNNKYFKVDFKGLKTDTTIFKSRFKFTDYFLREDFSECESELPYDLGYNCISKIVKATDIKLVKNYKFILIDKDCTVNLPILLDDDQKEKLSFKFKDTLKDIKEGTFEYSAPRFVCDCTSITLSYLEEYNEPYISTSLDNIKLCLVYILCNWLLKEGYTEDLEIEVLLEPLVD